MQERQKSHIMSSYFAPRGHQRMYELGMQIAQQYLSPFDKLIGIIGDAGSGKSAMIRGMFPGLELTNDDDGVYVRPLPLLELGRGFSLFTPHTYHMDVRFENGFTQMSELAEAVTHALQCGKRVIVEHFDLLYPILGFNANLLIGVGEQVLIARPTLFGPEPAEIRDSVYESLRYRLMAHTAEELCEMSLPEELQQSYTYDDVRHGFVWGFSEKPDLDLAELERKVCALIEADLPVTYVDHDHVSVGDKVLSCTGPRVHVSRTSQIEDFRLLNHFVYDRLHHKYLLVGCVGKNAQANLKKLDDQQKKQSDLIL